MRLNQGPISIILLCVFSFSFYACSPKNADNPILYYANPMDPTIHSDTPMKDSMGMDYVPIYKTPLAPPPEPTESPQGKGQLLYYANPMDPTVHSDKPIQDEMGMDYIPMYAEVPTAQLTLTAQQEKIIGVAVSPVIKKKLDVSLQTLGKVSYDGKKTSVISARIAGRIENLAVNFIGSTVTVGQPLLSLYSPALMTAQQELLQAAAPRGATDNPLFNNLLESARAKLLLWGFTSSQIADILHKGTAEPSLTLLSPFSGTVVKLEVSKGMYVQEGTILYEISDLSKVWIEAEIYEKDFEKITPQSRLKITPLAYPDLVFEEKISFISPFVDPATRTIRIRAEIANPQAKLIPGMYVTSLITTPLPEEFLTIPESALLDTGKRKIVYVQTTPGRYAAREVIVKNQIGNFYPIVQGLQEGELVVTSANFLIDSESRLKGLVE